MSLAASLILIFRGREKNFQEKFVYSSLVFIQNEKKKKIETLLNSMAAMSTCKFWFITFLSKAGFHDLQPAGKFQLLRSFICFCK